MGHTSARVGLDAHLTAGPTADFLLDLELESPRLVIEGVDGVGSDREKDCDRQDQNNR